MADRDASSLELQEVEPSPVEETPSTVAAAVTTDAYFPSITSSDARPLKAASTSTSTSNVGLSQHSPIWYLSRIQQYSTYAFTAFAAAHIANTSLIPLVTRSVPASESFLLLTRPYYQGLPAEPLLVALPLWAHVLSGIGLRLYRRHLNAKRYGDSDTKSVATFFDPRFWPSVSGVSKLGFPLVPLVFGHVVINRGIPRQFPGGSSNVNLSYVSHAFSRHPLVSYVGFAALLALGCFHITWGWAKWLGFTPDQVITMGTERRKAQTRRWYLINVVSATVTGLWMAGGFGVIARGGAAAGWIGRQYDEMYHRIPLVGRWL